MKFRFFKQGITFLFIGLSAAAKAQNANAPIWQNDKYSVFADKVIQGSFEAKALSATQLVSSYQSPANKFKSPQVIFKFSINGRDNEMVSGTDHVFNCVAKDGSCDLPLIEFGNQLADKSEVSSNTYMEPNTNMRFRLDMREVVAQFKKQGFYTTFKGDKIYKEDFKGVFVAGNTAPLTWDFDNLAKRSDLELKDPDVDGIYELDLKINVHQPEKEIATGWKLQRNISAFPQYHSDYQLTDALYNLAIEEMENAVEPDSTFRTGKEWAGVWTRDISYSIILSMAVLQPEVAMKSLMRKVSRGRIIQDTGTGGAYPVSTDRIVWATAAWEIYKVTGDRTWLKNAYSIIKNSADDDRKNAYDAETGLIRGESSFLDWREQTYPKWMQPADIYISLNLGTNAVHYQANIVLSEMAQILNEPGQAALYKQAADKIKTAINKYLWQPEKGYYGQYLYGRTFKTLSPRSEALGEALTILFDIAGPERQRMLVENTPVNSFGIPCIYPQIPGIPPYHNNAVWPFVQSYWAMAAAKAGNEQSVLSSLAAIYRPAALFLTNKENFVSTNGDYAGTQINSSNMLWSLSGSISMIYKVLFGMEHQSASLKFHPFVPKALAGSRTLQNFKYRKAILDISLEGYGNRIKSFALDGKILADAVIPANLSGKHSIKIVLENNEGNAKINEAPEAVSPATPELVLKADHLSWIPVAGALNYKVLKNGKMLKNLSENELKIPGNEFGEYQVIAFSKEGYESFASEPVVFNPAGNVQAYQFENTTARSSLPYKGFLGKGFIETSKEKNTVVNIQVSVPQSGWYAIDLRYANGNGPINTENKCAIRTLKKGKQFLGTLVLPQRGTGVWSDWGYSNSVMVNLVKGSYPLSITLEKENENMNINVNQAMLDQIRLTRIR